MNHAWQSISVILLYDREGLKKILITDLELERSQEGHLTNPTYLKDLDVGEDFTFETLFTKELVKSTASESKE